MTPYLPTSVQLNFNGSLVLRFSRTKLFFASSALGQACTAALDLYGGSFGRKGEKRRSKTQHWETKKEEQLGVKIVLECNQSRGCRCKPQTPQTKNKKNCNYDREQHSLSLVSVFSCMHLFAACNLPFTLSQQNRLPAIKRHLAFSYRRSVMTRTHAHTHTNTVKAWHCSAVKTCQCCFS